jgi:anthraniloyl-CoA monooxygenase
MKVVCVGAGPAGLYFAILAKRRDPSAEVCVLERNPEGVTYGWGVTFSDDVLDSLYAGDPESAARIRDDPASWGDQLVTLGDQAPAHLGGYGFAIGRHRLLEILAERAVELGVRISYRHQVEDLAEFADADLIVAADGANSAIRERYVERFGTQREAGRNHYIWLGTSKVFPEFRYAFEPTEAGWIWFYAYPFDHQTTTFIVECTPATWTGLGFDRLDPEQTKAALERIFARHLDGHPLLMQSRDQHMSPWLHFTWITNQAWYHGNLVLAGDAAHTTHFSIGNGTKLAIDDAIELDRQVGRQPDLHAAVAAYQQERIAAVGARQRIARASAAWFEDVEDFTERSPTRFAYSLRTRTDSSRPEPGGVPWLLHLATQSSLGRQGRRWLSAARRWRRNRQRGAAS